MNFHPLQVVGRGSETQLQGGENLSIVTKREEGSIHNKVYSHTHWWCFHYETYCDISRYRTPLYYMYSYTCCIFRVRKYKRCSFSCGMEKYSTCPRNKVFASPYFLDECCIFQYRSQVNTVCISNA